jgi:hypothetical protein
MLKNNLKLMALMVMSSVIFATNSFSGEKADALKEEAKKLLGSTQREIHKHALGFGLGQTFLLGTFENNGDDKIAADLLYTYTASYSFDLMLNAHISTHEYKKKAVWLRGYTMSIKGRSSEFDSFSPFLLAGLGFYMPQVKDSDGITSEAKYTFGANAGAGIDLRLNKKFVTGIIAQYHFPFEIKQDDTENIRGSYVKLLLTTMYLF